MRQIGHLANAEEAQRFAAYLLTQQIAAHAELDNDEWTIWIKNEDQITEAKEALSQFRDAPQDPRYRDARDKAAEIEREEERRREQARKNVVEMRGRWKRAGATLNFKETPLTLTLIGLSIFVGVLTGLSEEITDAHEYLLIARVRVDPESGGIFIPPTVSAGFGAIRSGEVWRLVTPIFIHFGMLHLVFNMWWLYSFGSRIERRYGTWRLGLLVLLVAIVSNVLQYMWSDNPLGGGMSGVVYGTFGFVWMKVRFDPKSKLELQDQTVVIMIVWLFLCMAAAVPPLKDYLTALNNVGNTAHFVGLAAGMGLAFVPKLYD
jgi:GlpG protein